MDSLMIEANIKNLSRAELLYACVAKLVIYIHKDHRDDLLSGLEHYYNANDFSQTFYYSDSQFLQDSLQKTERQETDSIIIADGAYCGAENTALAASINIKLVTTDLTGIDVPDIYADFELNKEGNRIIKCPTGHSPISCCCSSSNGHIHASFSKEACMNCPHKNECKIKEHKIVCSIDISAIAQYRATTRRYMKTDEFNTCTIEKWS